MTITPQVPEEGPEYKTLRVSKDVHARIAQMADRWDLNLMQTVSLLTAPSMVRLHITDERRARWKAVADGNGMDLAEFIIARVEAAIQYGVDPGVLRRMHDMIHALTRAADIIPTQTAGPDRQVVTDR